MPSSTTAWNRTAVGVRAPTVEPKIVHPKNPSIGRVMVTGGAGYVGAMLVPALLDAGYAVNVLDLYLYGDDVLADCRGRSGLTEIKGDIRDLLAVNRALAGCGAVIHLAC